LIGKRADMKVILSFGIPDILSALIVACPPIVLPELVLMGEYAIARRFWKEDGDGEKNDALQNNRRTMRKDR